MPPPGLKKPTLPLHLLKELGVAGKTSLDNRRLAIPLTRSYRLETGSKARRATRAGCVSKRAPEGREETI
jgi:hypothetical protein